MNITSVKIFPIEEEKLKAYVTIVIEDSLVIRDVKIIKGNSGRLFVAMPSKKCKNGSFRDIVHPLNQSIRNYVEQKIFETYNSKIKCIGDTQKQDIDNIVKIKQSG